MFNAITASESRLEGACTCTHDVARFLMEIVELQGRVIKCYGRIGDTQWMIVDDGLLLSTGPDNVFSTFHDTTAHLVWIEDAAGEESFTIEQLLDWSFPAGDGSIIDTLRSLKITINVGLRVERVISLCTDSGLHAFPPNEVPVSDSLDGYWSKGLHAFGLVFFQSSVTGYLCLETLHLFIQGLDWRYSGHPWFKMDPRLAMPPYTEYVLFVGQDDAKVLSIDGNEKRYCLCLDLMFGSFERWATGKLFHHAFKTSDWENEPYYNSKESLISSLKVWRAILAHRDWKTLYVELCKDTYEPYSEYATWPKLFKEFEQADFLEVREAIQCLYDWVSAALDAAGGVYAYFVR
ncbi:hypothetical protein [Sphaerochaeta sp.]|uniref:hypothetical protein n=1 Tax=Sphaerochaeta sp. TaxID=1972642 RepID=UPI002A36E8C6|nr:hypothetical protein [Sphaerochaeta sp.]MDX9983537.1 hypothetical protein [Sphaerochaeta sp.]